MDDLISDLAGPGSIASILSVGSIGSVLSIGSIASLASVGSIASVGSVGSVLSVGGVGAIAGQPVLERVLDRAWASLRARRSASTSPSTPRRTAGS